MKILFCSSEVYPYSKTGGLGDVAHALPMALGARNHEVLIVTPRYKGIEPKAEKLTDKVSIVFVEHDGYFDRKGLYGDSKGDFKDNAERFAFFSRNILKVAEKKGFKPDIIHLNDWHTALVPCYLKEKLRESKFFKKTRTLLTIHNLVYQGAFPAHDFEKLKLPAQVLVSGDMGFFGRISFLKAGILRADHVSTVSKSYANEILTSTQGSGLDGALRMRHTRVVGIQNGLDTHLWDPAEDSLLDVNYDVSTVEKKLENKIRLQKTCGFKADKKIPLFGLVARIVREKGIDLIVQEFDAMMKLGLQFVLLGTGEAQYHQFFSQMDKKYKGRFASFLAFRGAMAPKVYAGSDFFLMPSQYEPCGLGQLISFRYGTVPIVHKTGGLRDTVRDIRSGSSGSGIVFDRYDGSQFVKAVKRGITLYRNKAEYKKIQKRIMQKDHSWKSSAKEYETLYRRMLRK